MNQQIDLVLLENIRSKNDLNAKNELVLKYLPMIRHIIRMRHYSSADFDDFFQEGAVGLLKAIKEYDPTHYQIKFSTFAYVCISRRIFNAIRHIHSKKSLINGNIISLYQSIDDKKNLMLMDLLNCYSNEPFWQIETEWINQKLDSVLKLYLSPIEYQVIKSVLAGDSSGEIQLSLSLSPKVIDNARTRARVKLRKILNVYGSLLNPNIPQSVRKRKDLTIDLEVG